ncbi:MAG TPA: VOC family protein [Gemmatimonadaceae bacterium]
MSPAPGSFAANNELALHVADPAAAESFYVDVLGCAVPSRTDDCLAPRPHGTLFDLVERASARDAAR